VAAVDGDGRVPVRAGGCVSDPAIADPAVADAAVAVDAARTQASLIQPSRMKSPLSIRCTGVAPGAPRGLVGDGGASHAAIARHRSRRSSPRRSQVVRADWSARPDDDTPHEITLRRVSPHVAPPSPFSSPVHAFDQATAILSSI
jgi:hypothetical protein